jgi:hypothetical protein
LAGEVAEAERAYRAGFTKAIELEDRIEDLERRQRGRNGEGDRGSEAAVGILVKGLLEGQPLSAEAEAAAVSAAKVLGEIRLEVGAVRSAREKLHHDVIPTRRERLLFAEMKVEEAAKAVVSTSGAIVWSGLRQAAEAIAVPDGGRSLALALLALVGMTVDAYASKCGGALSAGATQLIPATTNPLRFTIANIDASTGGGEPIWISFDGVAAPNAAGSRPLAPPSATSYAGLGTSRPQAFRA